MRNDDEMKNDRRRRIPLRPDDASDDFERGLRLLEREFHKMQFNAQEHFIAEGVFRVLVKHARY